jgi:hypothetical protein
MRPQIESVSAAYNLLAPPDYTLRRVNTAQGRFYLADEKMYISVTSLIDMTTRQDEGLIRKMSDMGYDKWMQFLNERANYGTIMHILIAEFLEHGYVDFDLLGHRVAVLFDQYNIPKNKYFIFYEDLCQDMLAFCKFAAEYKVQPLAIELPLISKTHQFGGTLDLVCKMIVKEKGYFGEVYKTGERKGEPKESTKELEIYGVVDFKSGRNGFTDKHADQLMLCEMLLKENYDEFLNSKIPVRLFNWAPKAWRTEPSYTLKDQSMTTPLSVIFAKLTIAKDMVRNSIPTFLHPSGIVKLGDDPIDNFRFRKIFEKGENAGQNS